MTTRRVYAGPPHTSQPHRLLCGFQKTKDHFLEVKMESSRQRFFHLLNNVAYIEVSDAGLQRTGVLTNGGY